jgi:hypothetical protein
VAAASQRPRPAWAWGPTRIRDERRSASEQGWGPASSEKRG